MEIDEDCDGYCEKNGQISEDGKNCLICYWVNYNNENGNEWDIHVNEINIEEIEVKE